MKIRIALLRLFVASWAIPLSWLVFWPFFALLSGPRQATADVVDFNKDLWNGI